MQLSYVTLLHWDEYDVVSCSGYRDRSDCGLPCMQVKTYLLLGFLNGHNRHARERRKGKMQ